MNTRHLVSHESPHIPSERLRIFDRVPPHHHGVVLVTDNLGAPLLCAGEVAVYETDWLGRNELAEGLYCVEYQRTVSCLPREDFAKRFAEHDPTARLETERAVVQVCRYPKTPEGQDWWLTRPMGPQGFRGGYFVCSDGPMDRFVLTNKLLGPIVGIYRPGALREGC